MKIACPKLSKATLSRQPLPKSHQDRIIRSLNSIRSFLLRKDTRTARLEWKILTSIWWRVEVIMSIWKVLTQGIWDLVSQVSTRLHLTYRLLFRNLNLKIKELWLLPKWISKFKERTFLSRKILLMETIIRLNNI